MFLFSNFGCHFFLRHRARRSACWQWALSLPAPEIKSCQTPSRLRSPDVATSHVISCFVWDKGRQPTGTDLRGAPFSAIHRCMQVPGAFLKARQPVIRGLCMPAAHQGSMALKQERCSFLHCAALVVFHIWKGLDSLEKLYAWMPVTGRHRRFVRQCYYHIRVFNGNVSGMVGNDWPRLAEHVESKQCLSS